MPVISRKRSAASHLPLKFNFSLGQDFRPSVFFFQHLFLRPLRSFSLLTTDLLDPFSLFTLFAEDKCLNLVHKEASGEESVIGLTS